MSYPRSGSVTPGLTTTDPPMGKFFCGVTFLLGLELFPIALFLDLSCGFLAAQTQRLGLLKSRQCLQRWFGDSLPNLKDARRAQSLYQQLVDFGRIAAVFYLHGQRVENAVQLALTQG